MFTTLTLFHCSSDVEFKLQHKTMGIHGLAKLIADQAPGAIKEQDIKNYFGNYDRFLSLPI